ncbi:hypothetical protein CCUS01_02293 [Colletotrichum cuscutae]|uniref:Uncharacterized protein n=1 Tax=Colletotrichum cuscutae TaxID=1209917 RepID=A0AAI9TVN1_9PEZI|nr:hypothetical protein CCUS01_02293 [Colletotrichum cuscutae]
MARCLWDPYCPKPTSPGRPIPPGLIWWSPKGPGLCSLALPLDGLVRKGTARYRSSNGTGRKLHTSNGASQPASQPSQATSSPPVLARVPISSSSSSSSSRRRRRRRRRGRSRGRVSSNSGSNHQVRSTQGRVQGREKVSLAQACPVSCLVSFARKPAGSVRVPPFVIPSYLAQLLPLYEYIGCI